MRCSTVAKIQRNDDDDDTNADVGTGALLRVIV